jgi:hypothetical protein
VENDSGQHDRNDVLRPQATACQAPLVRRPNPPTPSFAVDIQDVNTLPAYA